MFAHTHILHVFLRIQNAVSSGAVHSNSYLNIILAYASINSHYTKFNVGQDWCSDSFGRLKRIYTGIRIILSMPLLFKNVMFSARVQVGWLQMSRLSGRGFRMVYKGDNKKQLESWPFLTPNHKNSFWDDVLRSFIHEYWQKWSSCKNILFSRKK